MRPEGSALTLCKAVMIQCRTVTLCWATKPRGPAVTLCWAMILQHHSRTPFQDTMSKGSALTPLAHSVTQPHCAAVATSQGPAPTLCRSVVVQRPTVAVSGRDTTKPCCDAVRGHDVTVKYPPVTLCWASCQSVAGTDVTKPLCDSTPCRGVTAPPCDAVLGRDVTRPHCHSALCHQTPHWDSVTGYEVRKPLVWQSTGL